LPKDRQFDSRSAFGGIFSQIFVGLMISLASSTLFGLGSAGFTHDYANYLDKAIGHPIDRRSRVLLAEAIGDKHEKIDSLDDLIEHCQSVWQDITFNMNTVDKLTNIKIYSVKLDFKVNLI
jgi:hypothetical protein